MFQSIFKSKNYNCNFLLSVFLVVFEEEKQQTRWIFDCKSFLWISIHVKASCVLKVHNSIISIRLGQLIQLEKWRSFNLCCALRTTKQLESSRWLFLEKFLLTACSAVFIIVLFEKLMSRATKWIYILWFFRSSEWTCCNFILIKESFYVFRFCKTRMLYNHRFIFSLSIYCLFLP